ncbi:MAG: iron-containing alcohol dehydrogenase [Spirochaetales bacterium]|nr:iron-containing alcohol dehydrogenase [Spirochaetales bacterium]
MADLKMNIPPEVIIGSVNRLGDEAVFLGNRILLIADSALEGAIDDVRNILESRGLSVLLFSDAVPVSTTFTLNDALSMARGSHANVIIGMGGVKTLQLARATASLAVEKIFVDDYLRGAVRPVKGLPYIELPTSGRNPFMFRSECFLTEHSERYSRICPMPEESLKMIFLDPLFLDSYSDRYLYMAMMDILLHSVEAYLSPRASFFSDVQASRAISEVSSLLGFKGNAHSSPDRFSRIYEASLFSAYGGALNGVGAVTVLSYMLSGYTGKPKGAISTVLLPLLLESSFFPGNDKKLSLAKLCHHEPMPEDFKSLKPEEVMRRFQGLHELPSRFSALGITAQELSEAASLTYSILEAQIPSLTQEALFNILQAGL